MRDRVREDLKHRRLVKWGFGSSSVPGTHTLEITHQDLPYPVATVWFRFVCNGTRVEVLNSFTVRKYRRCGLRTLINDHLFEAYPDLQAIVTDAGSPDGGGAFLKARHYKRRLDGAGFELLRRKR